MDAEEAKRSSQRTLQRIHGQEYQRTLEELKRQREERTEGTLLPEYATFSSSTAGRQRDEGDAFDNRTQFARDRDRIIYSQAFFRLSGKTQVFLSPTDPLISTRMTHTVHVSQIARSLARDMGLNEDLVEAIALGHDLGHPPFGHTGEEVLNRKCEEAGIGGFHHNIQSLHIVDRLEKGGKGLNLSWEVREGIVRHDGESDTSGIHPQTAERGDELWGLEPEGYRLPPSTPEACLVRICDRIAYAGKDIEDGIRAGLFAREQLPEKYTSLLGNANNLIIDTIAKDILLNFHIFLSEFREEKGRDPKPSEVAITVSPEVLEAMNGLIGEFNYPKIYFSERNRRYVIQTTKIVDGLFEAFVGELREMRMVSPSKSLLDFAPDSSEEGEELDWLHHKLYSHFLSISLGEIEDLYIAGGDPVEKASAMLGREDREEYKRLFADKPAGTVEGALSSARRAAKLRMIQSNIECQGEKGESVCSFLKGMDEDYITGYSIPEIARDFLSSLTDQAAINIFTHMNIPRSVV